MLQVKGMATTENNDFYRREWLSLKGMVLTKTNSFQEWLPRIGMASTKNNGSH